MRASVSLLAAALVFVPAPASAQLHLDASAQVGAGKRFADNRPSGTDDAGFGLVGQLTGHVALFPLVRVGAYLGHEVSTFGDATRDLTWGGVRGKLMSPFLRRIKPYFFLGFGYAGVYERSFARTVFTPTGIPGQSVKKDATVQGAGGSFFDLPFGVGASYKIAGPIELAGELGVHLGFGHTGSVYDDPGPQLKIPNEPDNNALPLGSDRLLVGLTLGILLDL